MQISISEVESRRFGFTVARAHDFSSSDRDPLFAFCEDNRVELAIVRIPAVDFGAIHAIEDAGGRLMDTLVEYRATIAPAPAAAPPECPGFTLRMAEASDVDGIIRVARHSFAGYASHYTADSRIDPDAVREGYAEWAASHVNSPACGVVIALRAEAVVGFSAIRFDPEKSAGRLVLVGIEDGARGKGIYPAFLRHHLAWCRRQGGREFFASTQFTNLRSQRAWQGAGFRPIGAQHTFHLWISR